MSLKQLFSIKCKNQMITTYFNLNFVLGSQFWQHTILRELLYKILTMLSFHHYYKKADVKKYEHAVNNLHNRQGPTHLNHLRLHWTYTVKAFNFKGTKFCGLTMMDMLMDTWILDFQIMLNMLKWINTSLRY